VNILPFVTFLPPLSCTFPSPPQSPSPFFPLHRILSIFPRSMVPTGLPRIFPLLKELPGFDTLFFPRLDFRLILCSPVFNSSLALSFTKLIGRLEARRLYSNRPPPCEARFSPPRFLVVDTPELVSFSERGAVKGQRHPRPVDFIFKKAMAPTVSVPLPRTNLFLFGKPFFFFTQCL